jgi:hypothetical protein
MADASIQPIQKLNSTNRNSAMDRPTRTASARAMSVPCGSRERRLRSMNTPADASATTMASRASTITVFICVDYFTLGASGA